MGEHRRRCIGVNESHKTRWSVTTFLVLAALVFSVLAFRKFTSALIFMGVVLLVVIVVNAAMRLAGRRKSATKM
jgi:hypothetical protein